MNPRRPPHNSLFSGKSFARPPYYPRPPPSQSERALPYPAMPPAYHANGMMIPQGHHHQQQQHLSFGYGHGQPVQDWGASRGGEPRGGGGPYHDCGDGGRGGSYGRGGGGSRGRGGGRGRDGGGLKRTRDGRGNVRHNHDHGSEGQPASGFFKPSFLEDPWLPLLREEERHQQHVLVRDLQPGPAQHIQEPVQDPTTTVAPPVKDDAEIDLDVL